MSAHRARLSYRGFDLRLENGFTEDEAREVVDRALAQGGDRVSFVMARPRSRGVPGRPPRIFVKAEFRRPGQALGKRLRPARAIAEGRGYRVFHKAGLPVPRLFVFGEQSRLRPRAGAIVVTEKVRGLDAARSFRRQPDVAVLERVARTLAAVHGAELVHGDAVLRNFVLMPGADFVIDLPGWGPWSPSQAEHDLALCTGSAMKAGADLAAARHLLDTYAAAYGSPAEDLDKGWRERVLANAEAYRTYLLERDATRPERHAKQSEARRAGRAPAGKGEKR